MTAFMPPWSSPVGTAASAPNRRQVRCRTSSRQPERVSGCCPQSPQVHMTASYPNRGYAHGYNDQSPSGNADVIRRVTGTSDIVETAAAVPVIKTLVALLRETGLDYELAKCGPFTVFAPTDIAFSQLCEPYSIKLFASLLRPVDRCALKQLLSYHIVKGCIPSGVAIKSGNVVGESLAGFPLTITGYGNKMSAGSGSVVKADIPCANGVIHLISSILTPSKFVNLSENPRGGQPYTAVLDIYSHHSNSEPSGEIGLN